jgi:hypothetical protein
MFAPLQIWCSEYVVVTPYPSNSATIERLTNENAHKVGM